MDEFVREFLVESYENLDQLDQDLVALEGHPGSPELLSRVFRTIHTIKGTCGFLAFGRLESLTHAGESLLSELRDGQQLMSRPTTDVLLRMVDTVRQILASIEATGAEGDVPVDGVIELIRGVLQNPGALEDIGNLAEVAVLEEIVALVDVASPQDLRAGEAGEDSASQRVLEARATVVSGAPPDDDAVVAVSESAIRVDVDVLDALMRQVGELVLARNEITRLVGGQVDPELIRASQRLSLIASDLHAGVLRARMQPIGRMWAQMPRVVRDLEKVCHRKVRLDVVGGDTQLDRALLEAVKDPLMHLVRNAVDHGIEDEATRVAAGKPSHGLLTIRAHHAGGRVVVEVEDDGMGINAELVGAAAVARGVRTQTQVSAMGSGDLLQLLTLPGFSMAETVTSISGRGVGLDVVCSCIAAIGGTVEVESTVGGGTTWRLSIPLTLAIISALIVECSGERYAIPEVNVLEFVAPDVAAQGVSIEYVGPTPVLRLRGALLPLVELRDVLGLSDGQESRHDHYDRTDRHDRHDRIDRNDREVGAPRVIAVLEAHGRRFGLIVTRVLDKEEIVVMPLAARLRGIGVYAGATLLGDGRVSLILDVPGIARIALTSQHVKAEPQLAVASSEQVTPPRQVLLVGTYAGHRVAIPLDDVTRLERVDCAQVEHVGGHEVLQYGGAIVPLVRLDRVLRGALDVADEEADEEELFVVMFTQRARSVAVVVKEILDIVSDDATRHSHVADQGLVGSSVLGDRVTQMLDVRRVVLAADPSFFDEDVPDDLAAPDAAYLALRAVGA